MSCCGQREKGPPEYTARWSFITLSDFKSTSSWQPVAYGWLWFMAMVSIAVYAVDTFTAVNLLIFNEWSSQVQPALALKYSRWIFAGCILFSWALCIVEWIRAIRVIRRDGVAESYMDPLAVTLQSMRSRGFKRFLVFSALTKSRKGADYAALFVYFAFKGAIRVVLAEGPRQVINGLTLYSVMQAKLIVHGAPTDTNSSFIQFFLNIKALTEQNDRQAVILFSMLFTLVIWVFSALSLIAAALLYLSFLWHYIPQSDGRLSIYCRRKIDKRLEKVVEYKVKAAIEEENRQKERAEKKAELKRQRTGELPPPQPPKIIAQPTLPQIDSPPTKEDGFSDSQLSRQDTNATVATLPLYSNRPPPGHGIQRQPTLPEIGEHASRRMPPSRSVTQGSGYSAASYESDAPLLPNAGHAGGDPRMASPAQTYYPRQGPNGSFSRPPPGRTMTNGSQAMPRAFTPMSRADSQLSGRPPPGQRFPVRSNTGHGFGEPQSAVSDVSPTDAIGRPSTANPFRPVHDRQDSQVSYFSRPVGTPAPRSGPGMERRPTYGGMHGQQPSISRRAVGTPAPPPEPGMDRRPPYDNPHSQPSLRNPTSGPRLPPVNTNFTRQPPIDSLGRDQPTPQPNSYEMTPQPSFTAALQRSPSPISAGGGGGYVAFNPGLRGNTPNPSSSLSQNRPPLEAPHHKALAVSGLPGQGGSYFGQVRDQSQAHYQPHAYSSAPHAQRDVTPLSVDYADILDDYGEGTTPGVDTHRGV